MTPTAFRKLAMSLPDAHEEPHFMRTSFRVKKKIFATMMPDGSEAMVRVARRERLYSLLEEHPETFFSYGGWTDRNGALGIRLPKVGAAVMRDLMIDSWRDVASKRAQASFSSQK